MVSPRVIPANWRLARGLLRLIAAIAIAVAVFWVPLERAFWEVGPLWLSVAVHLVTPAAAGIGLWLVGRRLRRGCKALRALTWTCGAIFVVNVVQVGVFTWFLRSMDDVLELGRSCGPTPVSCRDLAKEKYGEPPPLMPRGTRAGRFIFRNGEESGQISMFVYSSEEPRGDVIFAVRPRQATGLQPPADEGAYALTPQGRRVLEGGDGDAVRRLDFWDERYHYTVSLQGVYQRGSPQHQAALELADSAA